MKILHLCLTGSFTDNASYQDNMLAKFHTLQGYEVIVLTTLYSFDENGNLFKYNIKNTSYTSNDGYKVVRIDNKKGIFSKFNSYFRRFKNTYNNIKKENPDILFIHGCQFLDIVYAKKYFKFKRSKKEIIKIYVDNHADYINSAKNWLSKQIQHRVIWRFCAKLIEPYTSCFYGVTPVRCDFLNEMYGIPRNKIKLLYLGVDDTLINLDKREELKKEFCIDNNISINDFLIVTGGKIDTLKNIHLLLQAFKNLNNQKAHLIVFGSITEDMKDIISDLLKQNNVHYLGWIDTETAIKLFTISDLGVFPGTHSVYWEQVVGCGLPAIFKYWQGMDHIDMNGNCVMLRDVTPESIQLAIENMINNESSYYVIRNIAKKCSKYFLYSEIARKSLRG